MELVYTLKEITGANLLVRFQAAINEKNVGFEEWVDEECGGSYTAKLAFSDPGDVIPGGLPSVWVTHIGRYRCDILNPDEDGPARVRYEGAWRAFGKQNLPPRELVGETTDALVFEGSAYDRHDSMRMTYPSVKVLAEVYGLMQKTANSTHEESCQRFLMSIEVVKEKNIILDYLVRNNIHSVSGAAVNSPGTERGVRKEDGDTSIVIGVNFLGEFAKVEILSKERRALGQLSRRAIAFFEGLKPLM